MRNSVEALAVAKILHFSNKENGSVFSGLSEVLFRRVAES